MSYNVFLSYKREAGSAEARVLQSALQARGKECFLEDWLRLEISYALRSGRNIIPVMFSVTTIIWQRVRNPIAISALCGLSQLVSSYIVGILFFDLFRMYALGIFSFLFGALVIGTIGLARFPHFPRSGLWAGPLGGVAIYLALAALAGVPGFKPSWQIASLPISAALIGGAFFYAIPPQEIAAKT